MSIIEHHSITDNYSIFEISSTKIFQQKGLNQQPV